MLRFAGVLQSFLIWASKCVSVTFISSKFSFLK